MVPKWDPKNLHLRLLSALVALLELYVLLLENLQFGHGVDSNGTSESGAKQGSFLDGSWR